MRRLAALGSAATVLAWAAVAAGGPGELGSGGRAVAVDERELAASGLPSRTPVAAGTLRRERLGTAVRPVRRLGAEVRRRTIVRAAPGGSPVTTIGLRTEFDSPQTLAVVARNGHWLGVLHPSMPNGRAGWIPRDAARLVARPWEIEVDLGTREATVRRDGRLAHRFAVGIGADRSPTPTGRFAVTDRLVTSGRSVYGCCILALSGRQTRLPPGWPGGDRLALHGRPGDRVEGARSAGCLTVRERDLRAVMNQVPVGTRVTVRG
jgi:hypothetical protein